MKRYFLPGLLLLAFMVVPAMAFAQLGPQNTGAIPPPQNTGSPPGYTVPPTGQAYTVQNPLAANSFCGLVKNLLQAAIAIGIPVAVLFIVYAGFKFVLARGNAEKLKEARQNFLWTIIGIAIFLGAWLLASVIANTVNQLGGQQSIISCN